MKRASQEKWAVFTDLDGTFIDFETYSAEASIGSLRRLAEDGIPVFFCSSKTRGEQKALMNELGIEVPCIVENGSGLFFPESDSYPLFGDTMSGAAISWGISSEEIRIALQRISNEMGIELGMYSDLDDEALQAVTGLGLEGARRARERDFSETLTARLEPEQWDALNQRLGVEGLKAVCGGRFYTVTSLKCDKSKALLSVMEWLNECSEKDVSWKSMALGDSANDAGMLDVAEVACVVQRPDGQWNDLGVEQARLIDGIGPEGWARAVSSLLVERDEG